jgi:hypothetical protein
LRPAIVAAALVATVAALLAAMAWQWLGLRGRSGGGPAAFVGSETCAGCHQAEAELWRSSQHKHAMDHATEASVLGDFANASFDHYGVRSRFFRKDGKFFVETRRPSGRQPRSSAGMGPRARGSRPTPMRSMPPGTARRRRRRSSPLSPPTAMRPPSPAPGRSPSCDRACRRRTST